MPAPNPAHFRFGIGSGCLGSHASHTLEVKLQALQEAGYHYFELGFNDYLKWVQSRHPDLPLLTASDDDAVLWDKLYDSTSAYQSLQQSYGLKASVFQVLGSFEGWPSGDPREESARRKAEKWLPLLSALGCGILQVGSNDKDTLSDSTKFAKDLAWLANLGAKQNPPVKIAYEPWCFSEIVNTWEKGWEIVQLADHPNLGLCLDVAHFPMAEGYGWDLRTGHGFPEDDFQALLSRLRQIPPEKIFYVEISEVIRPSPALGRGSIVDDWLSRNASNIGGGGDKLAWSLCGRPLPLVGRNAGTINPEDDEVKCGGRVTETFKAILDTGFKGLVIQEFIEAEYTATDDLSIPARYAKAAVKSQELVFDAMGRL